MKIAVETYVADNGWACRSLSLEGVSEKNAELRLEYTRGYGDSKPIPVAVEKTEYEDGRMTVMPAEFPYGSDWTLYIGGEAYTRKNVSEERVEGLDQFEAKQEGEVLYRLYSPESSAPRPLILFLHGGGESGFDNFTQMVGTIGAIHLAGQYPDMYVMAPQAPARPAGVPLPPLSRSFAESSLSPAYGWNRSYLSKVCDIIRRMIEEGKADPQRVYVTGMSMGGGGTLTAMSVGADLFAAAAPICPTMTPETYEILKGLTHAKIWISTAYVDHTVYRHKYIVDGIMELKDRGNQSARLTLYSPEELAAYGIATDPELTLQERFGANHASWILTYHDEHGILSWLTEQVKG